MGTIRPAILVLNNPMVPRISPELAKEIGLTESILLLQIEFWIRTSTTEEHNGLQWMYQSLSDLHAFFPFWSETTIMRAIHRLVERDLLFVGNYNKYKYDRTQWFTINPKGFPALRSIRLIELDDGMVQNAPADPVQNAPRFRQNAPRFRQIEPTIPYTTTEITTDNIISANAEGEPQTPGKGSETDLLPDDGVVLLSGNGAARPKIVPPRRAPRPVAKPAGAVDTKTLSQQQAMVGALARVTQQDVKTCATKLAKSASNLIKAGYTPEQIKTWYGHGPNGWWFKNDWRGIKGHIPTIHGINETVLQAARGINPANARSVAQADAAAVSPDEKEQQRVEAQIKYWEAQFKVCAGFVRQSAILHLLAKDPLVGEHFKHLLVEAQHETSQVGTGDHY